MASAPRRGKPRIKPPRKHGPEFSLEETWTKLSRNIREIHKHNAANLSFEENHRYAYNMVLYKHGERLYNGVNLLVAENVDELAKGKVIPAFPAAGDDDPMHQSQEGETLLKAVKCVWDDHVGNMSKLRDILKYMDRVYTRSAEVPVIYDSGLYLFYEHITRPPIKDHLYAAILKQIYIEREGFVISRSVVKECVDMLIQLHGRNDSISLYKRDLEPMLLRESNDYYKNEGDTLLETCDASDYLRRVESRFESEETKAHHYLSSQTAAPLRKILEETLLTAHLSEVINKPSGLDAMINLDKADDIARMFRLFVIVPSGLPTLKRALKETITRRGADINKATLVSDPDIDLASEFSSVTTGKGKPKGRPVAALQTLQLALKWVQDVLDLKDRFDRIWKQSLQSDREIEGGFTEAFEDFINANEKSPEFISLFIDENLKKGLKGKSDSEIDAVLDKTITVFRYISEKDVFERYYKGHLAKRLLHGRSVSDDAERGMLAKLKIECGFQFTQKLEGMFNDVKLSADSMESYQTHLSTTTAPKVDISVMVMTSTFWPMSHSDVVCNLPEELLRSCQSFEQFYLSRHSGRRLTWQPSLGSADVRTSFRSRTHDLNVSTLALVILLLFENLTEGEFLTYKEIKTATAIVDGELQRHLQSLACAKYKILKKHPAGREINPNDSFSFNEDFASPLQKIKISTIASKVESGEERKETMDRVEEERRHQTEACIVRIMKDRKHMTHNDLVNEVTRQLASRFQPNPVDIKKRIGGLIEREYLERCEDRKSYNYQA